MLIQVTMSSNLYKENNKRIKAFKKLSDTFDVPLKYDDEFEDNKIEVLSIGNKDHEKRIRSFLYNPENKKIEYMEEQND